jgi:hypothetical protein
MTKIARTGSRQTPKEPAPKSAAIDVWVVAAGKLNHDDWLIICGALGKEVVDIVNKHGWDAEVVDTPAILRVFPKQIVLISLFLELTQMNKKGPKIQGECCALALYFRYFFTDCVSPDFIRG